jgi:hypothetical protein
MTTYTVLCPDGSVLRRGLSAVDAAREILGYDGYDYDLRRDRCGWQLYISRFSRCSPGGNGGMVEAEARGKLIYSLAETEKEAWEEIARQVIASDWLGCPIAVPDIEYQRRTAGR